MTRALTVGSVAASLAIALGLLFVGACDGAEPAAPRTSGVCNFGVERAVAIATGARFDAIALASATDGPRAVWSDGAGLFTRALGPDGTPAAAAVRIGARCRGGIAAATDRGRMLVACLAPPDGATGVVGAARLLTLEQGAPLAHVTELGPAGRDSRAIALSFARGRAWIAWHDGTPGAERVRLTSVAPDGVRGPVVALGNASRAATSPALGVSGSEGVVVAWAETWIDEHDKVRGVVRLADTAHPSAARDLEPLSAGSPALAFARDERSLVLAFRDQRPRRARQSVYVERVGPTLRALTNAVYIGRANGAGGPALATCGGRVLLAVPRTYGRREVLVGLHRLDPRFVREGGELQIYQANGELSHAALECVGASVLVLYAERGSPAAPGPRLRTTMLTCPSSAPADRR